MVAKLRIEIQRLRQDRYAWDDKISEISQKWFAKVLNSNSNDELHWSVFVVNVVSKDSEVGARKLGQSDC